MKYLHLIYLIPAAILLAILAVGIVAYLAALVIPFLLIIVFAVVVIGVPMLALRKGGQA